MAILFSGPVGMGYNGSWVIDDTLGCTTDEEYMETPEAVGTATQLIDGRDYGYSYTGIDMSLHNRHCFYIHDNPQDTNVKQLTNYDLPNGHRPNFIISYNNERQGTLPSYRINSTYGPDVSTIVSTNVPIFMSLSIAQQYVDPNTTDAQAKQLIRDNALNYISGEVVPDGEDFSLNVAWTSGTWISDNQPAVTNVYYQNVRGKITSGKFALYKIEGIDDSKLKYGIKSSAQFYGLEYSTDGQTWTATQTFPFEFIYRRRENELGSFGYALYVNNDIIPIWDNATDAQGYIDGTKDITEASNWNDISSNYPYVSTTEDGETLTVMGEAGNRGIFSQVYIVPLAGLYEIANALYDTDPGGLWEDIKKGLEMYGQNPIDAVSNLAFYPLDMSAILPNSSQNYIYFGGYKFNMTNAVARVANPNGYKTLGTMTIKRSFKSWRDYEPYTKLFIYLPYIGTYQLELSRYYDKATELRYYFDVTTNTVLCALLADNKLTDYWTGQMGVNMPITMTNFALYAQTQIQTLLGGIGGGISGGANMAAGVQNAVKGGAATTAAAASLGVGAGLMIDATIAKTMYGITQNNINNFAKTKGGSTSMLNEFLPQYPYFIFEVQEDCAPANYGQIFGYPSMKSGRINSFGGFLKVHNVDLNVSGATESEREKILSLLMNGIYI